MFSVDVCFDKAKEVDNCAVATCYTGENGILMVNCFFVSHCKELLIMEIRPARGPLNLEKLTFDLSITFHSVCFVKVRLKSKVNLSKIDGPEV